MPDRTDRPNLLSRRAARGLLGLAVCLLGSGILSAAPLYSVNEFVMRVGDDPAWSDPGFDDAGWDPIEFDDVPGVDSVLWLRGEMTLTSLHREEGKPLGIFVAAMASHEVWWDGELIGRGGVVGGTPEQERPGPIETYYHVPDRLAGAGEHHLALRVSAFHRHFRPASGYWYILVGDYARMIRGSGKRAQVAGIALSGILMVAIFGLMMFVQDMRDKSFLFLGLLCLTAALLLIAESWRSVFGYTYNWHLLRLTVVTSLAWLLDVLLLVFLTRRFPLPGARWFLAAGMVCATVPVFLYRSWDPKTLMGFLWVFSLATLWCLAAALRRRRGAVLAAVGLLTCVGILVSSPGEFVDRNLYLAMNFLLLCLLASHVLQVRAARKEREHALLKSARLEIELLKKHLQPHFLMNSLTALSEWLEEDPALAAQMIQSLGEEFRILSEISHQRLIRMDEEIRLCRIHLEIMSHRKGRAYRMNLDGVDPHQQVPPAIFHTLVENAITHNPYTSQEVEFRLSEDCRGGHRRYLFESPMVDAEAGPAGSEGTGLRYIRARLQESFGQDWKLESGPQGGFWRTEKSDPGDGLMNIVVVEDEEVIARRLERLIREALGDRLTGLRSVATLSEALDLLDGAPIDVLFLDLNLHGKDGFHLLEGAVARSFQTIVVSAQHDQALRAFEFGVTDFIPKPFDGARVRQALDRVKQREPTLQRRLKYLAVRSAGQVIPISLEDVLYVQGADDYSEIHCRDGSQHLHDKTLRNLERLLPEPFERVHRSYIVNLSGVRAYLSRSGSRYFVELDTGEQLPVSRSKYRELKSRMG